MTTFLWISAALGTVAAVAAATHKFWRVWRKISAFIDRVIGVPAQFNKPAEPGMFELLDTNATQIVNALTQLADQGRLITEMHHELHPNSGRSLRDVADRTEAALAAHIAQSTATQEQTQALEEEVRGAIGPLAEAVNVAARSTPPKDA